MKFTYMLDTNTFSYIAKGRLLAASIPANLDQHQSVCISAVTEAEVITVPPESLSSSD